MQNETVLVFHNTPPQCKLHRDTGLPFADQFGMRFEEGKHFLVVWNTFPPEYPPVNLVDLPAGMLREGMQFAEPDHRERVFRAELLASFAGREFAWSTLPKQLP